MPVTINGSAGVTTNTGAVYNGLQTDTAKSATGTSVDFTGIPSWVKRVTVMLSGVSTNGTSNPRVQIGSGSVDVSGYLGSSTSLTSGTGSTLVTDGFGLFSNSAASVLHGSLTITLIGSNVWACSGVFSQSNAATTITVAGSKTLSGTLDRVRITTVNGTDTFDAGTINIIYE